MKILHLLLILSLGLFLAGCEGDEGPAGPPGDGGFDYIYAGSVADADGAIGEGGIVLLKALDPDGRPVVDINTTMTDAQGAFSMGSTIDAEVVPLGLEALVNGASLRAFLVDTDGQSVSPYTNAVVDLVTMVVGTPEGRSLADYPAADIRTLVAAAEAALNTAGTDLTDPEAIRAQLLTDIGGQLADLSGGAFGVVPSSAIVSVDPADVLTDVDSFYVTMTDGAGEGWDIDGDGSIDDGTSDTYDDMFYLSIGSNAFPSQNAPGATAKIEDGREVVLGPVVDLGGSGLDVTRKIYVPETGSFVRFAEILANNTGADISINVQITGNLGSDESTDAVGYSSNGNNEADEGDVWLTMKWDSDPTAGFFFPGAVPSKSEDDVEYVWTDVVVPAGETVVLFHWGFQGTAKTAAMMADELALIEQHIPAEMFAGISIAEAEAGIYIDGQDNVVGEAGAVAPLAYVIAQNMTTGTSGAEFAAEDGSFGFFLRNTRPGDSVVVTASDDTNENITVAAP